MFLIMRFLGSVILFLFFTFSVHAKVKIITIGDSTMAEYDPSTTKRWVGGKHYLCSSCRMPLR